VNFINQLNGGTFLPQGLAATFLPREILAFVEFVAKSLLFARGK